MPNSRSCFEPVKIGPITLRNRFIKSGANEAMTLAGTPTKALVRHHVDLARGGVGMTTVAYGAVSEVARTLPNQLCLVPRVLPDLKALVDAVHEAGARVAIQITHGGSFVTGIKVPGPLMSSSGGLNKAGLLIGNLRQRAMTDADMVQVTGQFVAAAKLCREAGADAVEIHMGHGYLLNQFISPLSNRRRDAFGGDAVNRVRFPAQVLAAVKRAVGSDLAVLAKINVADGVKGGATVEDGVVTARALEAAGADMLVLSGGRNMESTWFMFGSPIDQEEMAKVLKGSLLTRVALKLGSMGVPRGLTFHELYLLEYSRRIRAAVRTSLGYLGGVKSLSAAQKVVDEGFDCIVMARALIHDTGLIGKFQSGETTASGCTSCNRCIAYIYHPDGTRCVLNPPNDPQLNHIPARK